MFRCINADALLCFLYEQMLVPFLVTKSGCNILITTRADAQQWLRDVPQKTIDIALLETWQTNVNWVPG